MTAKCNGSVPLIHRFTIERFRGIKHLDWYPEPGVNVILGGGDTGKTTVLDAIALLLCPTNTVLLSDTDYWEREVENGFCIEAVLSLPAACGINQQTKSVWPWDWDGKEAKVPPLEQEQALATPVYRVRVQGMPDFDLAFEILQPDGTTDHFAATVRRRIGLVRLSGDDRNDRDLRLLQGSALDRLLSDRTLRSRLGKKLSASDVEDELKAEAKTRLVGLETAFEKQALPTGLSIGLTGGAGLSVNALIGLNATKFGVKLPLVTWDAGTRRLAALQIAAADQAEAPITVVDEVERGLEPYRQRILIAELLKSGGQVFVTTHSSAALSAASEAAVWYVDSKCSIGRLPKTVTAHRTRDPECFLARLAVIAEGATEVGFLQHLLRRAIGHDLLDRGIWITDGCGNDNTLSLLEGLVESGLAFAAFADDEGRDATKWAMVKSKLGPLLFRWNSGCIEENIIKIVPADRLEELIAAPNGETGDRLRTLADRLGIPDKNLAAIREHTGDLAQLIIDAAVGTFPKGREETYDGEKKAFRKHAQCWFKSAVGGSELAAKMFQFGLWPYLEEQLLPFLNAVRGAVGLSPLNTLPS
jgi:putative ATP-dependent endonuclease of the OLD family